MIDKDRLADTVTVYSRSGQLHHNELKRASGVLPLARCRAPRCFAYAHGARDARVRRSQSPVS